MENENELGAGEEIGAGVEKHEKLEDAGRGTDTIMAHMSLGEIVIPRAIQDDPEVQKMLEVIFDKLGADINEFTVGHEANKINPETGYPEFRFKFKKLFKKAAPFIAPALSILAPGLGTAIGGALLGAGATGAATLGSGLLGAGIGGLTGGGLKGAAIGGALGALTPNLKGIGNAISDKASGALSDFGNATGLSDVYNTASGALSDAAGGIKSQIGDAYNGSVLQDAFKSGGDVLKSAGLNTSPNAAGEGIGATGGGSSYSSATPSILDADIGNYKPNAPLNYGSSALNAGATSDFAKALGATGDAGINNNVLSGATEVANSTGSNYISPIASALLGTYTNKKAENQLLKQQAANRGLYEPYANFQFNPEDLTQDPGYKFNLEQGNQALDRAQLARGGYFSGEALKDASKFATGLADNTYNTAFNRALQTNQEGLRGAGALAGVNENVGNVKANSTVNTGNLFSGALGSVLPGQSFTNSGALVGGQNDYLSNLLRQLQLQRMMAA